MWGRHWVFAHNGTLPQIKERRLRHEAPLGETDSEHAFCWMMEQLRAAFPGGYPRNGGGCGGPSPSWAACSGAEGKFNFLLADGSHLYARCGTKLCYIVRKAPFGRATLRDAEMAIDFSAVASARDRVAVVATEPLTRDEDWQQGTPGTMWVFSGGALRRNPAEPRCPPGHRSPDRPGRAPPAHARAKPTSHARAPDGETRRRDRPALLGCARRWSPFLDNRSACPRRRRPAPLSQARPGRRRAAARGGALPFAFRSTLRRRPRARCGCSPADEYAILRRSRRASRPATARARAGRPPKRSTAPARSTRSWRGCTPMSAPSCAGCCGCSRAALVGLVHGRHRRGPSPGPRPPSRTRASRPGGRSRVALLRSGYQAHEAPGAGDLLLVARGLRAGRLPRSARRAAGASDEPRAPGSDHHRAPSCRRCRASRSTS